MPITSEIIERPASLRSDPLIGILRNYRSVSPESALASEIDLRVLLAAILETAGRLMYSPDGSVILYDPHRDGLYFAAAIGDSAPKLLEEWGESSTKRVPVAGSKAGAVFQSGNSLVEGELVEDTGHYKGIDSSTSRTTRSMVCVPLAIAGMKGEEPKRLGVIQILNKRSGVYTQRDRILLESFGSQAAAAIRNARLFRDLLSHSGLYSANSPVEMVDRLSRPPELDELSIMFSDMRGFTQLLQSMHNATSMHQLMSHFLTMLAEETLRFGGVVNKALGDGLLTFFGGKDGPKRAVKCAFAMTGRFDHIRQGWDESYGLDLGFLDIGIGIASGEVTVGAFGQGDMRDFTVMGVPVNLAFAFQDHARDGKRIFVDQRTFQAAADSIEEAVGPTSFELRKPGQAVGVRYHQYHLTRLKVEGKPEPRQAREQPGLRVFLCHSSADKPAVRGLYSRLAEDGFEPWLDEEDLLPGQDWQLEIKKAVRGANVVVVCLSSSSVVKEGYLQRELRIVLDVADEKPDGTIFVIPAKLEDCSLPDRLERLHHVALFESDGYGRLKRALEARLESISR